MASGTRLSTAGAAGFSLGTARAVIMGVLASVRDLGSREDCVQNFAFSRHAAVPLDRAGASTTTARSGNLMEMVSALTPVQFFSARSVGRAGSCRDIPRHSGAATAVPRTNLIRCSLDSVPGVRKKNRSTTE